MTRKSNTTPANVQFTGYGYSCRKMDENKRRNGKSARQYISEMALQFMRN